MNNKAHQEQSELITLLIADGIARKHGLNRRAAIQRCCRRLRIQTKSKRLYELFAGLCKSDNAVAVVEDIYSNMVKEGLF